LVAQKRIEPDRDSKQVRNPLHRSFENKRAINEKSEVFFIPYSN